MDEAGIDSREIARFSLSGKASSILEQNTLLARDLDIRTSGVILVNNQKIFGLVKRDDSLENLLIQNLGAEK